MATQVHIFYFIALYKLSDCGALICELCLLAILAVHRFTRFQLAVSGVVQFLGENSEQTFVSPFSWASIANIDADYRMTKICIFGIVLTIPDECDIRLVVLFDYWAQFYL